MHNNLIIGYLDTKYNDMILPKKKKRNDSFRKFLKLKEKRKIDKRNEKTKK